MGIDATFFNSRLSLTVDYFNKRTNGMLMTIPLPQYIGNSRPYGNVGDMKNSGVEIDLRYRFHVSKVSFDIGGNATYIRNRLIRLGNQNGWANYDTVLGNIGTITRAENGEPFPFFYGMRTAGIFQTADEVADYVNSRGEMLQPDARPGDERFVDCNGDGVINDADRVKIGKGAPDWTFGFNLAVAWKGIDLGAFFNATGSATTFSMPPTGRTIPISTCRAICSTAGRGPALRPVSRVFPAMSTLPIGSHRTSMCMTAPSSVCAAFSWVIHSLRCCFAKSILNDCASGSGPRISGP